MICRVDYSGDNARDEGMAYHVFFLESGNTNAFHPFQDGKRLIQAQRRPAGRSLCEGSPVTTM